MGSAIAITKKSASNYSVQLESCHLHANAARRHNGEVTEHDNQRKNIRNSGWRMNYCQYPKGERSAKVRMIFLTSWVQFDFGMTPNDYITHMVITSTDPPVLYAAGSSGVWKRVLQDEYAIDASIR